MFDYEARLAALRDRLVRHDLDLAIFGAGPDLQYLTGSTIDWRRCPDLDAASTSLFVPATGDPVLLAGPFASADADVPCSTVDLEPFVDPDPVVAELLESVVPGNARVGVGSYADATMLVDVLEHDDGVEPVALDGIQDDRRAVKSPAEVDRLRAVAALTDAVMEEVVAGVEPGDTMQEVEREIEAIGKEHGATHVSFPSTAIFNQPERGDEDAAGLANYDPDEPLESGTCIAFDVGFVKDGYCSDWGRSVFVGEPPAEVATAYDALQTAVVETIDAIGDEITRVDEVYPFVEAVCDRKGVGEWFRNRHADAPVMGHQIGVEVHEDPWLRPEVDADFEPGMVFAIEPKLWNPGAWYLRVEDMVLVTDDGAESLTTFDRERFVV